MDLRKAKESLRAAELCFEQGLYPSCANRCYYAMFQAAVVALGHVGFRREAWSHPALQAMFANELVHRRKLCPGTFSGYLNKGLWWRNTADYRQADISRKLAEQMLAWARAFVSTIEEVIAHESQGKSSRQKPCP